MTALKITAKGQITLKKELLKHLGVRSGQRVRVEPLPDGKAVIQAEKVKHPIQRTFGILTPENTKHISLTIEAINEITSQGWAREK